MRSLQWLVLIGLLAIPLPAVANDSIFLTQPDSPVRITSYQASQLGPGVRIDLQSINHFLGYKNASDKEIAAISFGFVEFDAFNELFDKFSAFTGVKLPAAKVPAAKDASGTWSSSPYAAFWTGVAYVEAVRFADGTIWRADLDKIIEQLRKFESSLRKEDLADKKRDQK